MTTEPGGLDRIAELAVYLAYMNTLVGGAAPRVRRCKDWMEHPAVGDMVLETSTIYWDEPRYTGTRIGWLRSIEDEWRGEGDQRSGPITVWTLELLDGRSFRWENAHFIRLPVESADMRVLLG